MKSRHLAAATASLLAFASLLAAAQRPSFSGEETVVVYRYLKEHTLDPSASS